MEALVRFDGNRVWAIASLISEERLVRDFGDLQSRLIVKGTLDGAPSESLLARHYAIRRANKALGEGHRPGAVPLHPSLEEFDGELLFLLCGEGLHRIEEVVARVDGAGFARCEPDWLNESVLVSMLGATARLVVADRDTIEVVLVDVEDEPFDIPAWQIEFEETLVALFPNSEISSALD